MVIQLAVVRKLRVERSFIVVVIYLREIWLHVVRGNKKLRAISPQVASLLKAHSVLISA